MALQTEKLAPDDYVYLPDEDAREFETFLRAGLYFSSHQRKHSSGGPLPLNRVEKIHGYYENGFSAIVGYVLHFEDPRSPLVGAHALVIDVHGNILDEHEESRDGVISVMSPLDFIGPAILARLGATAIRGVGSGLARVAAGARAAGFARSVLLAARIRGAGMLGASMQGFEAEFPALITGGSAEATTFATSEFATVASRSRGFTEVITSAPRAAGALEAASDELAGLTPASARSTAIAEADGAALNEWPSRGYRPAVGERSVTRGQWKAFSAGVRDQTAIGRAFSESSAYTVGALADVGRMQRPRRDDEAPRAVPRYEDLSLSPAQQTAAGRLVGSLWDQDIRQIWRGCDNALARQRMTEVRRLWNVGTDDARREAKDMARATFNQWVARFWRRALSSHGPRDRFTDAGLEVSGGRAPFYRWADGFEEGVTIEHWGSRLADDPTRAVDETNLMFSMRRENVHVLERIRAVR